MKVIILFGPPGSGKGTQGKIVAEKLSIPHIATGDIMREAITKGTELGKKVKEFLDKGELVPDDIVIEIIRERLSRNDTKAGFILDGFPRTYNQAQALDNLFEKLGIKDYIVVHIDVSDEEIIKRISGRRTCGRCGRVYNIYFEKPKSCECGGELYMREDDSPEKVKRRLEVYKESTYPVLEYYKAKNKIKSINGEAEISEVTKKILDLILR